MDSIMVASFPASSSLMDSNGLATTSLKAFDIKFVIMVGNNNSCLVVLGSLLALSWTSLKMLVAVVMESKYGVSFGKVSSSMITRKIVFFPWWIWAESCTIWSVNIHACFDELFGLVSSSHKFLTGCSPGLFPAFWSFRNDWVNYCFCFFHSIHRK